VDAQGSEVSAAAPSQVRLPATVQAVAGSASRMAEGPGASRPGSRPGSPARPAALAVRARRGAGSGTGEAALYEAQSPVSGRTSFASASEQAGGSLRHERSSEGHSRLRRGSRVSGEGAAGSGAGMGGLVAEGSTTSLASAARRMRGRVAPGDGDVPEGRLSEIAGGTRLARSLGRDAGPAPLSPLAREASPPPMHTEGGHGIGGAGGRKPGRRPDASGEESGDDGAGGGGRRRRVVDPDTGKRKVLRRKKRAGEAFALKDDTVYRGLDGRPLRTNINVDLHYLDMPTAYGAPAPKKEEKKRKGEDKKKEDKGHGKGGKHSVARQTIIQAYERGKARTATVAPDAPQARLLDDASVRSAGSVASASVGGAAGARASKMRARERERARHMQTAGDAASTPRGLAERVVSRTASKAGEQWIQSLRGDAPSRRDFRVPPPVEATIPDPRLARMPSQRFVSMAGEPYARLDLPGLTRRSQRLLEVRIGTEGLDAALRPGPAQGSPPGSPRRNASFRMGGTPATGTPGGTSTPRRTDEA